MEDHISKVAPPKKRNSFFGRVFGGLFAGWKAEKGKAAARTESLDAKGEA